MRFQAFAAHYFSLVVRFYFILQRTSSNLCSSSLYSPGEKLPPYPLRTHLYLRNHNIQQEALGGLKPPVTVGQALSSLPEHEKDELRQNHYVNFDFPFESTITTGSHSFLSNYHKALLQTFPPTYRFVGNKTSISRQS